MKRPRLIFTTLFFIAVSASAAYWLWYDMRRQLNTPLRLSSPTIYLIESGTSLSEIGHDLVQQNLLDHPYYFIWAARAQGQESHIKAGEYELQLGTTPLQLLNQFVIGKVKQHTLTLIEGWSFKQVMAAMSHHEALVQTITGSGADAIIALPDCRLMDDSLADYSTHIEGLFLPDTYHFPAGTTDVTFLRRACKAMQNILAQEWGNRQAGLPYQSPYEALIMASIIEKETASALEQAMIAGVFVRRLQKGMKLQSDPTVIYAMGKSYQGNIRRDDLKIDSPYNTYVYTGLPPSPIALAGASTIRAALQPAQGESLYFVAKGDGTHYFSKTLKEHNHAVKQYQLKNNNETLDKK